MNSITKMNPFLPEIIRQNLSSIAEEMTLIAMRSARSPALREAGDLSSALTNADGEIIAQGKDLPIHLGVMSYTVKELIKAVGRDSMEDGDIWILNQPLIGGNHLPDVKLAKPIFIDGELIAFSLSLAHWADIGGASPGSYFASAEDIWQEGLQIPPIRLYSKNKVRPDILAFIKANVRGEMEREGDIMAQVASLMIAEKRIVELVEMHGAGNFKEVLAKLFDFSEQQMRKVISSIPDGTYFGEDFLDDDCRDGPPVPIRVRIVVAGDEIDFDFSESAPQLRAPLNTTHFVTVAGVAFFMKTIVATEVFHTGGAFRPISIHTRKGTVLNPGRNYPVVGGNHETAHCVVNAITQALADVIPKVVTAGGCATGGLLIFSGERSDGTWWTFYETHGGGEGARHDRDGGVVTRVNISNMMNTLAEFVEAEYPLRVIKSAVRTGSGGRGHYNGGDGLVREYRVECDEAHLTTMFQRRIVTPFGLFGGENGEAFTVTLIRNDNLQTLKGAENVRLLKGDVVRIETAGGGGYGKAQTEDAA
ncbi:hydantoinase B/oxoprolinase family protein [Sneathiella sp. HT1-7]|uniref:hydantoinase B/oxoprolinase family protein n=1 Tax=Sneathiella sp. HT1-7 TaxID=2887192 RepID=UPI001D15964E|nr:hydantoinase B/oxoprolinase family protein [Sneathiella sp. HT1-7]MCC3306357.1 hydantoinase B/oxoprolinase family protein [Sneathiella sp. HT1-7]